MTRRHDPVTTFVGFDCLHSCEFPSPWPRIGDSVYCSRCTEYRLVTVVHEDWRLVCSAVIPGRGGGCRSFSRSYGADKLRALIVAGRHVMKYPSHVVSVLNGSKLVKTVRNTDPLLPFTEEIQQLAKENQERLRRHLRKLHDS